MKTYLESKLASVPAVVLLAGILLLAGCGGPPDNNPLLTASSDAYAAAAANPDVVSKAPEELKLAEADLRRGERLLKEGAATEDIEHYAYLTKQRVAIARETARLRQAEESIAEAEGVRNEVQLQARTAEAERARDEADASRREADRKTREAEAARDLAAQRSTEVQAANRQVDAANAQARLLAERIAQMEAEETARGLVLTLGDVLFDVGKSDLNHGSQDAITRLADFLTEYSRRNVQIEGFTDNTGSTATNQALSTARAATVKAALMARGISDSRVRTLGFGESYPKATNGTADGRRQNRRVEVIISDDSGAIPARTK